jgi:hypothetical protein
LQINKVTIVVRIAAIVAMACAVSFFGWLLPYGHAIGQRPRPISLRHEPETRGEMFRWGRWLYRFFPSLFVAIHLPVRSIPHLTQGRATVAVAALGNVEQSK